MARFLFAPIPFTGHINPGLPIAHELVSRGHEVRWLTTPRFRKAVEKTGARYLPVQNGFPYDEEGLDEQLPERAKLKGLAQLRFDLNRVFIDTAPGMLQDLEDAMAEEPVDVVVGDGASAGPGLLSERHGLPWGVYGISAYAFSSRDTAPFGLNMMPSASPLGRLRNRALQWAVDNVIFRDPNANYQEVRQRLGFPRSPYSLFDFARSADVYLQTGVEAFEYPRSDMPAQLRFIGSFVPEPPADWERPDWWGYLDRGKRVVLVTQGTIANNYDELIRPAIRALADEDLFIVVTTGSKPAEAVGIDPLPSNVRVERFIPYAHLMPKVDLLLTNGGYGSVQIALSHGVPIVAVGASEDKPEIANRVQWSGVGLGIKTRRPNEEQIRAAVDHVLEDFTFQARAEAMRDELARHNPAKTAGDLLEGLAPAETRRELVMA